MADGSRPQRESSAAAGRCNLYLLDDGHEYFAREVHALFPYLSYNTVHKRLQRGIRTLARLGAPVDNRCTPRADTTPPSTDHELRLWQQDQEQAPINAALRGWSHTARGRALHLLDVQIDPLRAPL